MIPDKYCKPRAPIIEITGTGVGVPERVMTNDHVVELTDRVDAYVRAHPEMLDAYQAAKPPTKPEFTTSDAWLREFTGVQTRHVCDHTDEAFYAMARHAANEAMERSGVWLEDIDLIIGATSTNPRRFPSFAGVLQGMLYEDTDHKPAFFDVQAGCTGFAWAARLAYNELSTHPRSDTVLVVAAEQLTPFIDFGDRPSMGIFGDAASAAVIQRTGDARDVTRGFLEFDMSGHIGDPNRILYEQVRPGFRMRPTEEGFDVAYVEQPFITMKGREVFRFATRAMVEMLDKFIDEHDLDLSHIDATLPHNANIKITDAYQRKMIERGMPESSEMWVNIDRYANTSAASQLLALHDNWLDRKGKLVYGCAFGAGLTRQGFLYQF